MIEWYACAKGIGRALCCQKVIRVGEGGGASARAHKSAVSLVMRGRHAAGQWSGINVVVLGMRRRDGAGGRASVRAGLRRRWGRVGDVGGCRGSFTGNLRYITGAQFFMVESSQWGGVPSGLSQTLGRPAVP